MQVYVFEPFARCCTTTIHTLPSLPQLLTASLHASVVHLCPTPRCSCGHHITTLTTLPLASGASAVADRMLVQLLCVATADTVHQPPLRGNLRSLTTPSAALIRLQVHT